MQRIHTLKSIADETGCDKRSAQNWLDKAEGETGGEVGELIGGTRYFSDEERELLLKFCKRPKPQTVSAPNPYIPAAADIPVNTGSAIIPIVENLPAPAAQTSFDFGAALATIDGAKGSAFENSKQLVNAVEFVHQGVKTALSTKIQSQKAKLKEDEQQLLRLEVLEKDFQRFAAFAGHESRQVAEQQTQVTEQLSEAYQQVMDMGKPQS